MRGGWYFRPSPLSLPVLLPHCSFLVCSALPFQLLPVQIPDCDIRASYREGIDTLEEYKENKALIAKERNSLERQLAELEENTPDKILDDPTPKMLDRVSSVHDILVSDSYSLVQKNEALKQIIDKIVYDRESDTLKIHFFLYHS